MKKPFPHNLLAGAAILSLIIHSGCAGGGGQAPAQNPGAGHPDLNLPAIDSALFVNCKGQVLERQANGRNAPLPGVTMNVMSGGQNLGSDVTDQNGVYHVRLRRGHHNAVRASLAGYNFEPAAVLATPVQAEVLPKIEATATVVARGRVTMRLSGHAASNPLDEARIDIRDASTNQLLADLILNGSASPSVVYPVGTDLLLTPRGRSNAPWNPASQRVRVTPDEQFIAFRWPEPVVRSPVARPTPRPVLAPVARPTPSSTFHPVALPTPTPTPRLIRNPFRRQ